MRSKRHTLEERALFEAHRDLPFLRFGQKAAYRRILRAICGQVNGTQGFPRRKRFVNGMNPVDEIVKIESLRS